jgi:hypothetical protein
MNIRLWGTLLCLSIALAIGGQANAQEACKTPYGIEVTAPKSWTVSWCAKDDLFKTGPHPNNFAFTLKSNEKGMIFDVVLKRDPGQGFNENNFVSWAINRYATGPQNVKYNHRVLTDETDTEKLVEVGGKTYRVYMPTYSINETDGVIRHKRKVAFVFFKFPGYEAFGFLRVTGEHALKRSVGDTFTTNENPADQLKVLLENTKFTAGVALNQ